MLIHFGSVKVSIDVFTIVSNDENVAKKVR